MREPISDAQLAEMEAKLAAEKPADWRDQLHNDYLEDVPKLITEVKRLRKTVDILWYTLSRDQKCWADESLADEGLPEVERGYRA